MGGIGVNVGDVSVSGSATTATPAAAPRPPPRRPPRPRRAPAAAAPTAVPERHHRAHRRVLVGQPADHPPGRDGPGRRHADRPSPHLLGGPLDEPHRPSPGRPMSRPDRSIPSDRATDRHRARPSGPPPFPLRSRGPARRQPLGTHAPPAATRPHTICGRGDPPHPASPGTAVGQQNRSRRIWRGRSRCSGNRCCELLGTGRRNPVPSRCSRQQPVSRADDGPSRTCGASASPSSASPCSSPPSSPAPTPSPTSCTRTTRATSSWPARRRTPRRSSQQNHGAACTVSDVKEGQLSGILSIPAINLQAPVEEGTDDAELNVAVGHAPASVWPGPGRHLGLPGPRRELLRAPQRPQAGRRDHVRRRRATPGSTR